MKIFDATLSRLERALDVRLMRHNALASNLANVDTPGYKPKDVDFAAAMAAIDGPGVDGTAGGVRITHPGHMGTGASAGAPGISPGRPGDTPEVPLVDTAGDSPGIDGNRVDLDRTMVAMAQNGLQYGAAARAAGKKLAILRYVASDGVG